MWGGALPLLSVKMTRELSELMTRNYLSGERCIFQIQAGAG